MLKLLNLCNMRSYTLVFLNIVLFAKGLNKEVSVELRVLFSLKIGSASMELSTALASW